MACLPLKINIWLFATPWAVAHQAPVSKGSPGQEYCSGLPFPSPGSSWPRDWTQVSCIAHRFFVIWATSEALCDPRTVALQAPLPMGFHRQEYWSGLPFPPPGDLLNRGIKTRSPTMQADSLLSEPPGKPLRYREWRYISVANDTSQLEKKKTL